MSQAMQGDIELAISASDRIPSIALRTPDGTIQVVAPTDRNAGDLTALIADSFAEHGYQPSALRAIRLDLGPGSYTGLRVAVTFTRIVQQYQNVTVHTCTSLQLIALAALRAELVTSSDRIRPVLDARRQRYHHALIAGDTLHTLQAPAAVKMAELLESVEDKEVLLAASPIHDVLQDLATSRDARLIEPPPWNAALLFDQRLTLSQACPEDLEPLYLMGSYAES